EECLGLGVDPVQVLEDHQEWLDLGFAQEQSPDGVERALPTLGRLETLPVGVVADLEQREQSGKGRLEGAIEGEDLARDLLADLPRRVAVAHMEVALEQIDHR